MITKDEQSKLRSTIALLSSMINGGEQHTDQSRKEVSEALSIVNNLPIQRVIIAERTCCPKCGSFDIDSTHNDRCHDCFNCGHDWAT